MAEDKQDHVQQGWSKDRILAMNTHGAKKANISKEDFEQRGLAPDRGIGSLETTAEERDVFRRVLGKLVAPFLAGSTEQTADFERRNESSSTSSEKKHEE
ncbi:unnamed protein product, partial [Amoebophrya sp. A25]|eukprot:GSA25T00004642001.1